MAGIDWMEKMSPIGKSEEELIENCIDQVLLDFKTFGLVPKNLYSEDIDVALLRGASKYYPYEPSIVRKRLSAHGLRPRTLKSDVSVEECIRIITCGVSLSFLKNFPMFLQCVDKISTRDYIEILDYYIDNKVELTDYQKKYLDRLGKL